MKLTKEQRDYLTRRLQEIRNLKKNRITIIPVSYALNNVIRRDDYPDKVNKAIDILRGYYTTEQEKYNAAIRPIDTAYTEALERTVFAENYEQIQQILSSFESL